MALLSASCTSGPHYGNNGYGGGHFPNQAGGIDTGKTAALVAAGIAGLTLYHYGKEKDRRRDAERQRDAAYAYGNPRGYYGNPQGGFRDNQRGYGRRGW